MKLTIVIPSRNEQNIITKTLNSIEKYVKTPHSVFVIDDSDDRTAHNIQKYIKTHPNVFLIEGNLKKRSFARALKMGFNKAESGIATVVMADLCDDPRIIDKMYRKILDGFDIVCGSRYIEGGKKIGGPIIQNFFSSLVCVIVKKITGLPTSDVSNAFKTYRLTSLKGIKYDLSSGVEASMKITLQAFFNGAKIVEIPTIWSGRTIGRSKFNFFHRAPKYARIIFWALKNSLRNYFIKLNGYTTS